MDKTVAPMMEIDVQGANIQLNVVGDKGRVFVVENGRTMLWESYARKQRLLRAKERKKKVLLTSEEKEQRDKELKVEREKENRRRWTIREERMGTHLTEEEHTRMDTEEKEAMVRKAKAAVDPKRKMAPLSAFFPSRPKEPDTVSRSHILEKKPENDTVDTIVPDRTPADSITTRHMGGETQGSDLTGG